LSRDAIVGIVIAVTVSFLLVLVLLASIIYFHPRTPFVNKSIVVHSFVLSSEDTPSPSSSEQCKGEGEEEGVELEQQPDSVIIMV
jgi:hypothetical protein